MAFVVRMDDLSMIALKYALFAVAATLINLLFQYFSFLVYSGFGSLYVAMLAGNIAGLLSKYVLDKKYIFYHKPADTIQDAKTLTLYTLTGGFTTLIFWGTEIGFDYFIAHEYAKYAGGALGLGIGYTIKYFLDKHFVFRERSL